jgi:geranylgeranyl transferase type-2 subunit beta
MNGKYLDLLDGLLSTGAPALSPAFRELQVRFVRQLQLPDGGFPGRSGGSDPYYTDFALRVLRLSKSAAPEIVPSVTTTPREVVECFSLLNSARMLSDYGTAFPLDRHHILGALDAQQLPTGGFARRGGFEISAYNTFLAALCYEMLDLPFPSRDAAVEAVMSLQMQDRGFSELPGGSSGQTNATAAAAGFLATQNVVSEGAALFLQGMQSSDGGFLAYPEAPEGDLLSTFTGLVTLFSLDAFDRIDLGAVARFAKRLADPGGGFRACLSDAEPDTEYTYYGLGTLCLLRAYVTLLQ